MSKKDDYQPFETLPSHRLMNRLKPAVYYDKPDNLATIVFTSHRQSYSVPIEVARMLHTALGDAIEKACQINLYKATYGRNPPLPFE